MEKLMAALMVWIGSNTSYNVTEIPHPEVRLLTAEEMTREYYSGSDVQPESGIDSRIFSLYNSVDSKHGIIYLLDPRLNDTLTLDSADPDVTLTDRSQPLQQEWLEHPVLQEQLLHELIHHVQYQTGAVEQFPCQAFAEREAYLLGGKYLQLRHANDPLPNRRVLAYMFSRC